MHLPGGPPRRRLLPDRRRSFPAQRLCSVAPHFMSRSLQAPRRDGRLGVPPSKRDGGSARLDLWLTAEGSVRISAFSNALRRGFGGVSRAAKGADCKSAGYAFVGSSPTSPTILISLGFLTFGRPSGRPFYVACCYRT